MHKTNGYRGWYIPEDATIEVDDVVVPVPQFIVTVREAIIAYVHAPLPKPNIYNSDNILRQWMTARTDLELQALRHYFLDRWTWDTGNDYDRYSNIIAEREITRRKNVDILFLDDVQKMMDQVTKAMRVPSSML